MAGSPRRRDHLDDVAAAHAGPHVLGAAAAGIFRSEQDPSLQPLWDRGSRDQQRRRYSAVPATLFQSLTRSGSEPVKWNRVMNS